MINIKKPVRLGKKKNQNYNNKQFVFEKSFYKFIDVNKFL